MSRDAQRARIGQMRKPPTQKQLSKQVSDFNASIPVGTRVKYHPVIGEIWNFQIFETSTPAYILSGHTAVVHLKGKSGCVAVEAVGVLAE